MSNGWNNKEGDSGPVKRKRAYVANKLLDEYLPEVPESPLPPNEAQSRQNPQLLRDFAKSQEALFAGSCSEFELNASQLECCQVCLNYCIDNDMIPKGSPLMVLQETFKIIPE